MRVFMKTKDDRGRFVVELYGDSVEGKYWIGDKIQTADGKVWEIEGMERVILLEVKEENKSRGTM